MTISTATNTMLSAITASTGGRGTCTNPSVAAASVMLCATVNAVTVLTSRQRAAHDEQQRQHEQQMIDAEQDVLDAEREIDAGHRQPLGARTGIIAAGWPGVSRCVHVVPSANSIRTSASVMVASRPAMRTVCPRSGRRANAPGLHCRAGRRA